MWSCAKNTSDPSVREAIDHFSGSWPQQSRGCKPTLVLVISAAVLVACFVDHVAPPQFRYQCRDDGDCRAPENCIDDLCQVRCTQATFTEDCPSSEGYIACFNGVCAHLCALEDRDVCPSPQRCLPLGIEVPEGEPMDVFESLGDFETEPIGVCGAACTDASGCPGTEICTMGFCAVPCTSTSDCPAQQFCFEEVCIPTAIDPGNGPPRP